MLPFISLFYHNFHDTRFSRRYKIQAMAEQQAEQTAQTNTETVDTTKEQQNVNKTRYDVWHKEDGLYKGEKSSKRIHFKNGFVRVRKEDWVTIAQEGWATETPKSFPVPPWHSCEVLGGPEIKFTES